MASFGLDQAGSNQNRNCKKRQLALMELFSGRNDEDTAGCRYPKFVYLFSPAVASSKYGVVEIMRLVS